VASMVDIGHLTIRGSLAFEHGEPVAQRSTRRATATTSSGDSSSPVGRRRVASTFLIGILSLARQFPFACSSWACCTFASIAL
jgi:hypothetical protein